MERSEPTIYILYGSATGNSEAIAKELSTKCLEHEISNTCLALNEVKKTSLKDEAAAVVIVCSTTGNGDVPENADQWWRTIKVRSAPKDMFSGLIYTVVGLGDTNYDKFCNAGKLIDKRISELGGVRLLSLRCIDEVSGLEEQVESWINDVFEKLVQLRTKNKVDLDLKQRVTEMDSPEAVLTEATTQE
jgi:sulfite reductase alpha subunit-like flavoprotein